MGYKVLSLKYRPQTFEEVVKQDHVTRTLRNAITSERLAHAILFSGPRGTGKTTIARILAKCVNCATGPTPTPCNVCRSCKEITSGHAADVFEVDGASNNKVDNIRELRENAVYMPAHSPYKIYIIDEIHMLSDSAFNALLKILEEPPAHVLFFFATTEPNKIPITILSRCQRHDLRRIDIDSIIGHLEDVCRKETIKISKEGLTIISRQADGSIRDALSLLDHVISSATGDINTSEILEILGDIDRQVLFDISQAIINCDAVKVIEIIDLLYSRGHHMMRCFAEILDHFRNLLLVKMGGGKTVLSDVPLHEMEAMRKQIAQVPLIYLNQIVDLLFKEEKNIKLAVDPRLTLEMAFIRMLQVQPALSLDALIEKIDTLQKGICQALSNISSPAAAPEDDARMAIAGEDIKKPERVTPVSNYGSPPLDPGTEEIQEDMAAPENFVNQSIQKNDGMGMSLPEPIVAEQSIEDVWESITQALSREHPSLAACFADSRITGINDQQITIEFSANQFNINYAQRDDNRLLLSKLWRDRLGREIKLSLIAKPIHGSDAKKKEKKLLEKEALNNPLVTQSLKLFNGKIVEIKIL
jgi:DNA polymerase III subunit gamma/tau